MDLMEPSVRTKAWTGWLWFALALFLLQALPYLSYRWVTDEIWYAGPGYSIALGHGVADLAIDPKLYGPSWAPLVARSDLAGQVHDAYYGDLKVYKLRD